MLKINVYLKEIIQQVAEDLQMDVHTSYSGRGMYGRKCFGVDGSMCNIASFVGYVTQNALEDELEDFEADMWDDMKVDQLGKGYIFYWENLEWEEN